MMTRLRLYSETKWTMHLFITNVQQITKKSLTTNICYWITIPFLLTYIRHISITLPNLLLYITAEDAKNDIKRHTRLKVTQYINVHTRTCERLVLDQSPRVVKMCRYVSSSSNHHHHHHHHHHHQPNTIERWILLPFHPLPSPHLTVVNVP